MTVPIYPACPVRSTFIRLFVLFDNWFPWCITALPERFEDVALANGVHALPERRMTIRHQLTIPGEPLERLLFKMCLVAVDVVEDLGLEDEEGAVNPAF